MARDNDKKIDMTYLSLENAEKRGFLHRDYLAHCFRWSHVLRHLKPSDPSRILDAGCGVEAPLAKTLYTNRHTKHSYLGVDYGPIKPTITYAGSFQPKFIQHMPIDGLTKTRLATEMGDGWAPDLITSFEVAEHMLPTRLVESLKTLHALASEDATLLISTPNYDPRVGPADNHINEMTWVTMLGLLTACGWVVENSWGTFASQRDYKDQLDSHDGLPEIFNLLHQYYDSNVLACIFAPLFPAQSRNILWSCKKATKLEPHEVEVIERLANLIVEGKINGDYSAIGQLTDGDEWSKVLEFLLVTTVRTEAPTIKLGKKATV